MSTFDTPQPFKTIIDRAMRRDKHYFLKHPDKKEYIRSAVSGELWPYQTPIGAKMRVEQFSPGVRGRELLYKGPLYPYPGKEQLCAELDAARANLTPEAIEQLRKFNE